MALPGGLSRIAVHLVRLLPEAVLARILPPRLGFVRGDDIALRWSEAPVRLLIAPANFAGQGYLWARAAERIPGVDAVSMAYVAGRGYGFIVDQRVPASVYLLSRRWAKNQRATVLRDATHVIIEAGRHVLGDVYGTRVIDEIRALQAAGVKVALLSHGSDSRSGERHRAEVEDSPYGDPAWEIAPVLERESAAHRELMRTAGVPVFVSTPGLQSDVPAATWLPVVVDPRRWETSAEPMTADVPLVVHAPSSAVVKGTHLIEPIITALVDEGLIRYERLEGIPSADMPAAFARADIVLDQFRLGDYGVAACEALAAGRLVIGNVTPTVRDRVRVATGEKLPIVQADVRTLEAVLRQAVARPAEARAIAAQGPAFVAAVHDGARSADVLRTFLEPS